MGLFGSKSSQDPATTTPMQSSALRNSKKMSQHDQLKALPIDDDPRSPSEEIARTPILVEASPCDYNSHHRGFGGKRTPLSSMTHNNSTKKDRSLSHKMFGRFRANQKQRLDDLFDATDNVAPPVNDDSVTSSATDDKENSDLQ